MTKINEDLRKEMDYETALDITGFGRYNLGMLVTCCLLIVGMYLDIFGFSVALPAVACDMKLDPSQQGVLSAIPLVGVMLSSYAWGLCADTKGRRKTLLVAMPIGMALNVAASMAPDYYSLAVIKLLSASFTSSANAAAFVLLGESVPKKQRGMCMFLMASITMMSQFTICSFALPVFKFTFSHKIPWLGVDYRPWRLLLQVLCIPGIIGTCSLLFFHESPKFLLGKRHHDKSVNILKKIYEKNTGKNDFWITKLTMDELVADNSKTSTLRKFWNQTAPLFKPPLLKNSAILYYLLLTAYMTTTGFTMWVPTTANAYFIGGDSTGLTFCEVASKSARPNVTDVPDCDNPIAPEALFSAMGYSGCATLLSVMLSFLVDSVGKKLTTLLTFATATISGVFLLFVRIPTLSTILFYLFLYVALILGNINTYLVELNPIHLRGMATCLSVVVARGFGFFSVQIIARTLADYCTPMISGYVVLVASGFVVAFFLPPDIKKKSEKSSPP